MNFTKNYTLLYPFFTSVKQPPNEVNDFRLDTKDFMRNSSEIPKKITPRENFEKWY